MTSSKLSMLQSSLLEDIKNTWFDYKIHIDKLIFKEKYKDDYDVYNTITGLKLIIHKDHPEYFNYNEFVKYGINSQVFGITSMFGSMEYSKYLSENNIELKDNIIKLRCDGTNKSNFVHFRLFELILSKINIIEYVRYIYKLVYNLDIFENKFEFINNNLVTLPTNKNFYIGTFMTLENIYISKDDCFIGASSIEKAVREKYNMQKLSPDSAPSSYLTVRSSVYNGYIEYIKKFIKTSYDNFHCKKSVNTITIFMHPILALIRISSINRFAFRNILVKEILDYKDSTNPTSQANIYNINLKSNIIKQTEDPLFSFAKLGDKVVIIETESGFIKINSLIYNYDINNNIFIKNDELDKKFEYKLRMFLKDESRFQYVQTLNEMIKENKLTTINTDQCEYDLSQLESIKYNTLKEFNYCVHYYNKSVIKDYSGLYVHPELFIYFIMYFDIKIAIVYIRIMFTILTTTANNNISMETYYKNLLTKYKEQSRIYKEKYEQNELLYNNLLSKYQELLYKTYIDEVTYNELETTYNELEQNNISLKLKYEELRNNFIKANPALGYLKISLENDQQIKVQFATNPLLVNKNTLKLYSGYDANNMYRKIKEEIKEHPIDAISYDTNNKFNITDTKKALEYIDNIMNNIYYNYNNNKYIKEEYVKLVDEYYKNMEDNTDKGKGNRSRLKGHIYEYQCAYDMKICMQKNLSKTFFIENNLTSKDIGFDLIDVDNKVLYQCKNYNYRICTKMLDTFFVLRNKLKDYKLKLIVTNIDYIPKAIYFGYDRKMDREDIIVKEFVEPKEYILYNEEVRNIAPEV